MPHLQPQHSPYHIVKFNVWGWVWGWGGGQQGFSSWNVNIHKNVSDLEIRLMFEWNKAFFFEMLLNISNVSDLDFRLTFEWTGEFLECINLHQDISDLEI